MFPAQKNRYFWYLTLQIVDRPQYVLLLISILPCRYFCRDRKFIFRHTVAVCLELDIYMRMYETSDEYKFEINLFINFEIFSLIERLQFVSNK